jgi:uncharacterized protein (TIGR00730 family)
MKSITVFCGSSSGTNPEFIKQAELLGIKLAEKDIMLVYGGAKVGLMGAVANGVLNGGGKVIGILPHFLRKKEVAHEGLTKLIFVDSMHDRKTMMNDHSEGVIALPGGYGTLEELFEMLTWAQLGLHEKPIGILNVSGYYNHLIKLIEQMVEQGLLKKMNQEMLVVDTDIDRLLDKMHNYRAPEVSKWITDKTV